MDALIRLLNVSDAGELFRLRRAALLESPEAFLASPQDDLASSEERVSEQLKRGADSVVFGAFTDKLIGMLGLYRASQRKAAHKVHFWGMFVLPHSRGCGIGERLLYAAIDYCRGLQGVEAVQLSVSESASAARALYEKAGFTVWGIEKNSMHVDGRSLDERHMVLAQKRRD